MESLGHVIEWIGGKVGSLGSGSPNSNVANTTCSNSDVKLEGHKRMELLGIDDWNMIATADSKIIEKYGCQAFDTAVCKKNPKTSNILSTVGIRSCKKHSASLRSKHKDDCQHCGTVSKQINAFLSENVESQGRGRSVSQSDLSIIAGKYRELVINKDAGSSTVAAYTCISDVTDTAGPSTHNTEVSSSPPEVTDGVVNSAETSSPLRKLMLDRLINKKAGSFTDINRFKKEVSAVVKRAKSHTKFTKVPKQNRNWDRMNLSDRTAVSDGPSIVSDENTGEFVLRRPVSNSSDCELFCSTNSIASQHAGGMATENYETASPCRSAGIWPPYFPSLPILERLGSKSSRKSTQSAKIKQRAKYGVPDRSQDVAMSNSAPNLHDVKTTKLPSTTDLETRHFTYTNIMKDTRHGGDRCSREKHKSRKFVTETSVDNTAEMKCLKQGSVRRTSSDPYTRTHCFTKNDSLAIKKLSYGAIGQSPPEMTNAKTTSLQQSFGLSKQNKDRERLKDSNSSVTTTPTKHSLRGKLLVAIQYFNPSAMFRVSLIKASNIQTTSKSSKSASIFAKVCLKPGKYKTKCSKKVIYSENPEIFEDFDFCNISFVDLLEMHLKIALYRKDGLLSFPKLIGETCISIINYDVSFGRPFWKTLRVLPFKVIILQPIILMF